MKKFFANDDAGCYYESPTIKKIEYDHFDYLSDNIVAYDGDISPKGLSRSEKGKIRYSYFWKNTIYDTYDEAFNYIKQKLEYDFNRLNPEYERLKKQIKNLKRALKQYENQ